MEEVVNAQTAELAKFRAQFVKQAKRGQISTDVTNQDSRRDDESGPHENRNHEFEWQVAGDKHKQRSQKKRDTKKILSKRKDSNLLEAADRSYDIFVGGCNLATTVDSLRQYCSQEIKVDIMDCFEIKIAANKYKCFKISLTLPNRDKNS